MVDDIIDPYLVFLAKRPFSDVRNHLTPEQCVAINLFRREGVSARKLARAFKVSPNTIYYRCLTGDADSYLHPSKFITARETKEFIDKIGVEAARQFITPEMRQAVEAELEAELKSRKSA